MARKLTKIATMVRKTLKEGSTHVDGTDIRMVDDQTWDRNVVAFGAYLASLPSKRQHEIAWKAAHGVRVAMEVYPASEKPTQDDIRRLRLSRALAEFADATHGGPPL